MALLWLTTCRNGAVLEGVLNTGLFNLEVRCYSGLTYAERPESFCWQSVEYRVNQVERSWLEPGSRCFRVTAGDNKLFRLCYNEASGRWSITELVRS